MHLSLRNRRWIGIVGYALMATLGSSCKTTDEMATTTGPTAGGVVASNPTFICLPSGECQVHCAEDHQCIGMLDADRCPGEMLLEACFTRPKDDTDDWCLFRMNFESDPQQVTPQCVPSPADCGTLCPDSKFYSVTMTEECDIEIPAQRCACFCD